MISPKEIAKISPDVACELLQDMYFIATLFEIQNNVGDDNKWLKDYYSKIGIPYLSIVLHECIQANLLDKENSNKKALKILSNIRQRIVKLVPKEDSKSIRKLIDAAEIDFDHYVFDLQISLNEKDNILYDIGFTYYDLLDSAEQFEIFNSLIKIPFQIIQDIISTNPLDNNEKGLMPLSQSFFKELGEKVSRKISLKKYPYASGVFFKRPEICDEDKILIMFYYTSVKQARMLDLLIPDNTYQGVITIDTKVAKSKFRAIVIENIGQFLKNATTPLAEELRLAINTAIDPTFFRLNRKIKDNIHYNETTVFDKNTLKKISFLQKKYLQLVLDIFDSKIQYNVGLKYRVIRYIANKTDSTMHEIRKKNKRIRKWEDVSEEEWEDARERIRKKTRK